MEAVACYFTELRVRAHHFSQKFDLQLNECTVFSLQMANYHVRKLINELIWTASLASRPQWRTSQPCNKQTYPRLPFPTTNTNHQGGGGVHLCSVLATVS